MFQAEKQRARDRARVERARLSTFERRTAAHWAATLATDFLVHERARTVAMFAAKGDEIDTRPLFEALRSRGVQTAFPIVSGEELSFSLVDRWGELGPGTLGILEPQEDRPFVSLDAMIVPAVALDRFGNRLGQGGGYYDRWLASHPRPRWVIGYVFETQVVERLPADPAWDRRVDAIVTERGWVRI